MGTAERFWARVQKSDGCWIWTGASQKRQVASQMPYGTMAARRSTATAKWGQHLAHRVSYELAYGEIPKGKMICHRCDVKLCVRPDHLYAGTAKENNADMMNKGRGKFPGATNQLRGAAVAGAKLSDAKVARILVLGREGMSAVAIAAIFNISRENVSCILRGKTWKHVLRIVS